MQLTLYTDYSLRVLVYLGLKDEGLSTITEISDNYAISRNHLVKVVHNLSNNGFIHTVRGKGGGMRLAFSPDEINIGAVVRATENNFNIVECFERDDSSCPITPVCALKGALKEASRNFLAVLDRYTLADVLTNRDELAASFKSINIVEQPMAQPSIEPSMKMSS